MLTSCPFALNLSIVTTMCVYVCIPLSSHGATANSAAFAALDKVKVDVKELFLHRYCVHVRYGFTNTLYMTLLYTYMLHELCHCQCSVHMNNHVHSAPQEHIERERKDSEHRKNTQNIHNITTIRKPHGLEKWGGIKMVVQ